MCCWKLMHPAKDCSPEVSHPSRDFPPPVNGLTSSKIKCRNLKVQQCWTEFCHQESHYLLCFNESLFADYLSPISVGFADPFDTQTTITLDNPAYRFFGWSLMCGKLDWLLLRGLDVQSKAIGNHDYNASDHKWLRADVFIKKLQQTSQL